MEYILSGVQLFLIVVAILDSHHVCSHVPAGTGAARGLRGVKYYFLFDSGGPVQKLFHADNQAAVFRSANRHVY